jgi:hypothetical protein
MDKKKMSNEMSNHERGAMTYKDRERLQMKKKGGECMGKYAAGGVAKIRLGQSTKDGKQKGCK